MIKIEITGLDELAHRFSVAPDALRRAVREKVLHLTQLMYDKVYGNLSGKILQSKTGRLRSQLKFETYESGDVIGGWVGIVPESAKALALEYGGHKSYIIAAINAKALHFYWEKVGQWVSFKHVNHPPSREYAYLRSVLPEMAGMAEQEFHAAVAEALFG